ncbi:MAG: hypothetical protein V4613_14495 [Bacteroidota bacterium]
MIISDSTATPSSSASFKSFFKCSDSRDDSAAMGGLHITPRLVTRKF